QRRPMQRRTDVPNTVQLQPERMPNAFSLNLNMFRLSAAVRLTITHRTVARRLPLRKAFRTFRLAALAMRIARGRPRARSVRRTPGPATGFTIPRVRAAAGPGERCRFLELPLALRTNGGPDMPRAEKPS